MPIGLSPVQSSLCPRKKSSRRRYVSYLCPIPILHVRRVYLLSMYVCNAYAHTDEAVHPGDAARQDPARPAHRAGDPRLRKAGARAALHRWADARAVERGASPGILKH